MKTAGFVFGLVILLAAVGYGQLAPTITNATLEKYQQQRLAAEKDYRENYERLGFPSPEELQRQREVDMEMRIELADQLRQARLEKERIEIEWERVNVDAARAEREREVVEQYPAYYGGYWGGYSGYRGYNGGGFGRFRGFSPFRGYPENWLYPQGNTRGYIATPYGTIRNPAASIPGFVFRGGGFSGRRK